jgi:signal transduction histidine kinase
MAPPGPAEARRDDARLRISDAWLEPLLRRLSEKAALALGLTRVGVWLLVDGGRRLAVFHQHDQRSPRGFAGAMLEVASVPAYLRALARDGALVVRDAARDPRLGEWRGPCLSTLGVASLMDVPVCSDGALLGVICHEHVGPPRNFSDAEVALATSFAGELVRRLHGVPASEIERTLAGLRELRQGLDESVEMVRLAAGLGHDLNNLLTVIAGNAELLESVSAVPVTHQRAREIRDAVGRGRVFVQELVDLGRRRPRVPRVEKVAEHVEHYAPFLEQALAAGAGSRLELVLSGVGAVMMDPRELDRVVLGLATSTLSPRAGDARVALEVADRSLTEGPRPGEWVMIAVSHAGAPLRLSLERLFEPFAHATPTGSRMGMVIVKDIVMRAGGFLEAAPSDEGRGLTVRAYLPRIA